MNHTFESHLASLRFEDHEELTAGIDTQHTKQSFDAERATVRFENYENLAADTDGSRWGQKRSAKKSLDIYVTEAEGYQKSTPSEHDTLEQLRNDWELAEYQGQLAPASEQQLADTYVKLLFGDGKSAVPAKGYWWVSGTRAEGGRVRFKLDMGATPPTFEYITEEQAHQMSFPDKRR